MSGFISTLPNQFGATCNRPWSLVSSFLRNTGGNVAIIFGLAIVPLFGIAGAALDYSQASNHRADLQAAADAAALAGGKVLDQPQRVIEQTVRDYLDANLPARYRGTPFSMKILNEGQTLQVSLQGKVPTSLLGVIGINEIDIGVLSETTTGGNGVEIALVLDVTGSMRDHMTALKRGAKSFVEMVFDNQATAKDVRVAVVPYVATVNVKAHPQHMQWMDVQANARWHGQNFESYKIEDKRCYPPPPPPQTSSSSGGSSGSSTPPPPPPPQPWSPDLGFLDGPDHLAASPAAWIDRLADKFGVVMGILGPSRAHAQGMGFGSWPYGTLDESSPIDCNRKTPAKVNHFDLFQAMSGVQWAGCVEARPEPYDTSDAAPTTAIPDTLWVPYLWPDERDGNNSVRNNYLSDTAGRPSWVRNGGDNRLRRAWVWKYRQGNPSTDESAFIQRSPNSGCPDPILPLTNHRNQITKAIDDLRSYGGSGTNSAFGLVWGWRTLSPERPFTEGAPYGTKGNRKIIVLMTDGMNEVVPQGNNWNQSDYTAYGYADNKRLGTNDRDKMRQRIDDKLVEVCGSVRNREITVYSVMFEPFVGALDAKTEQIFRDCATGPRNFFYAKNQTQLVEAFEKVAREITALRISR